MKKILFALAVFLSMAAGAQLIPQYIGTPKTQLILRGPLILPPAVGIPDSIGSIGRVPGSLNIAFFNGDQWVPLQAGTTWTLKAAGISPGSGNKGAALQSALSVGAATTLWAEEPGVIALGQTVNGVSKNLKVEAGTKFTNGTLTNLFLDAPHNAYVIDTSVASTVFLNTEIYAANYGFMPSASAGQNTRAWQRISALINSTSGGVTLYLENKGDYRVGREVFANNSSASYAYKADTLFSLIGCTKPVTIEMNGATIKLADGMHFGSFNPGTGLRFNAAYGGYYGPNAFPNNIFSFTNNTGAIVVRGGTIDGNAGKLIKGGYWDDIGIQLPADGIAATNNNSLTLDRMVLKNCGRDGFDVSNPALDNSSPVKKINLFSCTLDSNVRQGLSWTGGNHLYAVNSRFTATGRNRIFGTSSPDSLLASSPAAGIDMEAEGGNVIRNGTFDNCIIDNNVQSGLLTVGDVADVSYNGGKIIGATSFSIYASGDRFKFDKVTIVGTPVNLRIGMSPTDPYNTVFNSCLITMDSTLSPTGKVYGNYVLDFGGGANGIFNNCTIDSKSRGTVYGGGGCVFNSCLFNQDATVEPYNGYVFMTGNFYGTNRWQKYPFTYPYQLNQLGTLSGSKFYGQFYVNDNEVSGFAVTAWGTIPGNITQQADLQGALSNKAAVNHNHSLSGSDILGNLAASRISNLSDSINKHITDSLKTYYFDSTTLAGSGTPGNPIRVIGGSSGGTSVSIPVVAYLRTKTAPDSTVVNTAGYYAPGDGGGGPWVYLAAASSADDSATQIGRWRRIIENSVRPEQFGAKGDGTYNDTRALQKANNYCARYSTTLLYKPANFYNINSTIYIFPQAGNPSAYPSFNVTGQGLLNAAIIHWTGGDSTAVFSIKGLKNSTISSVTVDLGTSYKVAAWDIGTDNANGSTSFVSFRDCQVSVGGGTGNQGVNNVAWRLGHISTDASGDISEYNWYNCIVAGTDKTGSTGYLVEGGNTLGLKWFGGYCYNLDKLYSNFGTPGATNASGGGGGGVFFYGMGGHVCATYYSVANIGAYTIIGGRYEGGGRFLNTASAGYHPVITIQGVDMTRLSGPYLFYVDCAASLLVENCSIENNVSPYGDHLFWMRGFTNEGDLTVNGGAISTSATSFITADARWHVKTASVGKLASGGTASYFPTVASDFITGEALTGTINSSNTTFTFAYTPASGSDRIFYNGQRWTRGVDYTISGSTLTTTSAPATGSRLTADYNR